MSISIAQSPKKAAPPPVIQGGVQPSRESLLAKLAPIAAIALFFAFSVKFISPAGPFPLNDDWIYAEAVKTYLATGKFVLYGNCCAACPVHVLLGALVSKVAGFSHEALRITDLGLGFVGTLCLYLTLIELRINKILATLATLVYCSNPIFLNLYFSFMTDGPSTALGCMYMYGVVRGITRNSNVSIILGGCALALAVAVRQTFAAFIVVNCIILLSAYLRGNKRAVYQALWLVVLPALAYSAADHVLTASKTDAAYDWYKKSSTGILGTFVAKPAKASTKLLSLAESACLYLGLFLAPLTLPFFTSARKWATNKTNLIFLAASGLFTAVCLWQMIGVSHRLMPFSENLVRITSLGSLSIMGINFTEITRGEKVWLTIISTIFSFAFMVLMMSALSGSLKDVLESIRARFQKRDSETAGSGIDLAGLFCVICACASVALVILQTWVTNMDRYHIVPLAPCMVAILLATKRLQLRPLLALQVPLMIIIACYSIAAQQDYMGWNRARWAALTALEKHGVAPQDIDGGSEYFFVHEPTRENLLYRGPAPRKDWRWWPITDEKYIISFSPVPGYEQEDEAPYWSALSRSTRHVLVLKQIDPTDAIRQLPQPNVH